MDDSQQPKEEEGMKALKVIVLLILSLVFVVYGLAFMISQGVSGTLLTQEYYHTIVSDNNLGTIAHDQIAAMIPDIVSEGVTGGATISDPAQKAAVEAQIDLISGAIIDSLDESWISEQAAMITDDLVNSLNSADVSSLTAKIDMTDRLELIKEKIAEGLDKYSDAELMAMFGAPKAYIPVISEQIVDKLGLPDSLAVGDLVESAAPGVIPMIKGYLGMMQAYLGNIILLVVVIVYLVLCMLLFKVSGGLIWFGISTAISGGLFMFVTNFAGNMGRISSMTGMDMSSLPVPSDLIQNIVSFTFGEMNRLPIIVIAVGIVCVILGIIFSKKKSA